MHDPSLHEPAIDQQQLVGTATSSSNPSQKPPRVWTVFATIFSALVLAVVFQSAIAAVFTAIEIARGTPPAELRQVMMDRLVEPYGCMAIMLSAQIGFAVATLGAALSSAEPFRRRVAWFKPRPSWHVYPVAMLSSIAPLAVGLTSAWGLAKVLPGDESLTK